MKRFFACLLALALSMTGCAGNTGAQPETTGATETAPSETTAEASYNAYPITVTDQAGREVPIASEPRRIVSGYYISSSLLIALGQEEKIVGIEAKADRRPIYAQSAPALLELPSVGSAKEFDLEGCAALEPDLVILPMKLKEAAETLTELGIPTIVVNPEDQTLLDEARDIVANALNCHDRAMELEVFDQMTRSALQERIEGAEKPTVYMASNSALLATAGKNMYQNSLIELAGGINVAGDIEDSYWAEVSYEQLLAWDPDYIILAAEASYTPADVLADENLAGLTAIEEGRVYKMPSSAEAWDSPVPGSVLGAYWMASRLHSELVTEQMCNQVVGDFYETFYGFDYGNA